MSRPSSANAASRRPTGHGNNNPYYATAGTTPMYSYTNMNGDNKGSSSGTGKIHNNRPSSAGHTRPNLGQSIQSRINAVNAMAAAANQPPIYTPYPGASTTQNAAHYAMYTGSNTGSASNTQNRPKSAGTVRPSSATATTTGPNIAVPVQVGMNSNSGNGGLYGSNPTTIQQNHQQQYSLQQQRLATHFGYGSTNYTTPQHQQQQQSSTNSTSAKKTINQSSTNAPTTGTKSSSLNTGVPAATVTDPNQQWNNAYKMHYGYSSGTASTGTGVGGGVGRPSSSHTLTPSIPVVTSTTTTGGYSTSTKTPTTSATAASSSSSSAAPVVNPIIANKPITMPVIVSSSSSSSASSSSSSSSSTSNRPVSASTAPHTVGPTPTTTTTTTITHTAAEAAAIGMRATLRPASASSSAATTRLRTAIETSHKYISSTGAAIEPADPDDDFDEADDGVGVDTIGMGLDAKAGSDRATGGGIGELDDDMDGCKQMMAVNGHLQSVTRSHPEISTTTPSMEFGHSLATGSALAIGSLDSLLEEHINVGLTTVPNQFCSAREAVELKKLLVLSKGSRGGVVPSSTAVMDMYMVGKVVGVGSYGKVRAAWHRLTGAKVAIKTYDKSKMKDPAHWKRVHSEIKIMEQVSHPRIARMYEAVETPKRMHLIMECLDGGNLCSYVKAKRRLTEEESVKIFFQILQSIDHLHLLGVTHRDVKLENVLFVDAKDSKDIKLIDFGFSTVCQPGKKLKVFCGTPSYMAPEIVQRLEYEGKATDMWSMGILMYALLCGCFPFRAKSYPDLYRRIARGTFQIPDEISTAGRDLLRQLLNIDPLQRMTAGAAMRHPWLAKQFAQAGDMNKLRLETTILISDRPTDDIDDQVLAELETFGFPRDEMTKLILTKTHSSIATMYYLLMNHIIGKRKLSGGARRPLSSLNSTAHSSAFGPSSHLGYGGASVGLQIPAHKGGYPHHPNGVISSQLPGTSINLGTGQHQYGAINMGGHTNTTQQRPSSANAGAPGRHSHNRYDQTQPLSSYQQPYVLQQPPQAMQGLVHQEGINPTSGVQIRHEYVGGAQMGVGAGGNRPKSASGRPIITGPQRPLSAYVMRR